MSRTYQAILFAPDGDFVTDYYGSSSIEEVEELLANQGSRWYFYPFCAVITDGPIAGSRGIRMFRAGPKRLLSIGFPFENFQGRTVASLQRELQSMTDAEREALLSF